VGTGDSTGRQSLSWITAVVTVPAALRLLRPAASDSLYSVVYRTTPDYTLIGFVPGIGVARYMCSHHGTTAEAWLVAYQPGSP
jgi:hypothetical protein